MIGMPGLIEYGSFEDNAKLCSELGLDFIELNMNLPIYNHLMDIETIKRNLQKYDLKVSLHLSETFDPFVLDPIIRRARLDQFQEAVSKAKALDAFLLNMHMSKGIHFTLPHEKKHLYEAYKEDYLSYVKDFRQILKESGVSLCIENTGIHDIAFVKEATDLLLILDNVSLTYDIGHDITSGYKDRAYYEGHLDQIKHYHIHDGTKNNNHLSLFTGDLDIMKFIDRAKRSKASCVVEVKVAKDLRESIRQLRLRNEDIFNKTW